MVIQDTDSVIAVETGQEVVQMYNSVSGVFTFILI